MKGVGILYGWGVCVYERQLVYVAHTHTHSEKNIELSSIYKVLINYIYE